MPKILIAEDDILMCRLYEQAFSVSGYEVEIAHDGLEAFEKILKTKPNLALIDVMMPKMTGLELLEKIKSAEETKNIQVILLTNLTDQKVITEGLQKGATNCIIKDQNTPKDLVNLVKSIEVKTSNLPKT